MTDRQVIETGASVLRVLPLFEPRLPRGLEGAELRAAFARAQAAVGDSAAGAVRDLERLLFRLRDWSLRVFGKHSDEFRALFGPRP